MPMLQRGLLLVYRQGGWVRHVPLQPGARWDWLHSLCSSSVPRTPGSRRVTARSAPQSARASGRVLQSDSLSLELVFEGPSRPALSDGASGLRSPPCMSGGAATITSHGDGSPPTSPTLAGQVVVSCDQQNLLACDAPTDLSKHAFGLIGSPARLHPALATSDARLDPDSRLPLSAEPAPGQDVQGRQLPVPQRGVRQQPVLHQWGHLRQRRLRLPRWLQVWGSPLGSRNSASHTASAAHSCACRLLFRHRSAALGWLSSGERH